MKYPSWDRLRIRHCTSQKTATETATVEHRKQADGNNINRVEACVAGAPGERE